MVRNALEKESMSARAPFPAKILILEAYGSPGLAVLQSLGRKGHRCYVVDRSRFTYAAKFSRYATGIYEYPDPLIKREEFQEWVLAIQKSEKFDLIIPVNESTLVPLHTMRDHPEFQNVLAIPPSEALEIAIDKEKSRSLAASLGIPTPGSVLIKKDIDRKVLDDRSMDTPAVVKTVNSIVWEDEKGFCADARLATTREELLHAVDTMLRSTPVQIQEWVPGVGAGVEVLARNGDILMSFAHKRIHELPLTGGASSYREAFNPPRILLEYTARFIKQLNWSGVAMIEYRADFTADRYWFMEINPRFWGSLPLAVYAGADFPAALVDLMLYGIEPLHVPNRTRVYARNFSKDIRWTKENIKSRGNTDSMVLNRPVFRSFLEWGRVLTGRELWDGASLRDPGPILYEIFSTIWEEIKGLGRIVKRTLLRHSPRNTRSNS